MMKFIFLVFAAIVWFEMAQVDGKIYYLDEIG